LIVVDNSSTDTTQSIALEHVDRLIIAGPERSAQRNRGVRESTGELVLIHDSDIYFPAGTIEECVGLMQNVEVSALILPEESIGVGYWTRVKAFERRFYRGNDDIEAIRFFRRTEFLSTNGYDERLTGPEDWDLTVRYREAGKRIERTTEVLLHDEGRLQLWGSSKKKKYYASDMFEMYAKKHPEAFRRQMSFFVRFPINKILIGFVRHPILLLSMLLMKTLELWYSRPTRKEFR